MKSDLYVANRESDGSFMSAIATTKDILDWLLGCETCDGEGIGDAGDRQPLEAHYVDCPDCEGRGRRIPDKVVKAAQELLDAVIDNLLPEPHHLAIDAEHILWAAVEAWEAE